MKVIFSTGAEASITDVSSKFSLGIATTDADEVAKFKALLTVENLSSFQLVNDNGEVVDSAEDFIFSGNVSTNGEFDGEATETNFLINPMSPEQKRIAELEAEKELQAGAIEELAMMVAG